MSKKAPTPLRVAPLQRIIAEDITDPAEQAALDAMRRREKRRLAKQLESEDVTRPAQGRSTKRRS